jgi:hypothetical protein
MSRPRFSFHDCPLFLREADIWNSLDEPLQDQVLDCLAMLLLQHLPQTARRDPEERPLTKGYST